MEFDEFIYEMKCLFEFLIMYDIDIFVDIFFEELVYFLIFDCY